MHACRWCDRCNQAVAEPTYRYLANLLVLDHTGHQWLTAFGDQGDTIFGK